MHATWHILPLNRINPNALQILLETRLLWRENHEKRIIFYTIVVMLLLTNGLMNHVIVIPMMLDSAKRDSDLGFISWCTLLAVDKLILFDL
jgi:spore germination protein KB